MNDLTSAARAGGDRPTGTTAGVGATPAFDRARLRPARVARSLDAGLRAMLRGGYQSIVGAWRRIRNALRELVARRAGSQRRGQQVADRYRAFLETCFGLHDGPRSPPPISRGKFAEDPLGDAWEQNFIACDMAGMDLSGQDLSRIVATAVDLSGGDLRGARMHAAQLQDATLIGADLRGTDLRGSDLSGADLSRADLRDADLRRCCLIDTVLNDARMDGTHLDGACVAGTRLTAVQLNQLRAPRDGWSLRALAQVESGARP